VASASSAVKIALRRRRPVAAIMKIFFQLHYMSKQSQMSVSTPVASKDRDRARKRQTDQLTDRQRQREEVGESVQH